MSHSRRSSAVSGSDSISKRRTWTCTFLTIPLTYYSARWFRSIHPVVFGNENADAEGGFAVGSTMTDTIMVAAVAFGLLFAALVITRVRQLKLQDELFDLREELE